MARKMLYWKCDGCGEILQGYRSEDNFIADKELERPKKYRAIGCYLCGCPGGTFSEEVVEEPGE